MTSLSNHHSSKFVKLLYIGDSGAGKTCSLLSLVKAGYRVRILDMDNNLDSLVQLMKKECPDKLSLVDFETRRDRPKASSRGPVVDAPKAYIDSLKLLEKWSDGTDPAEWGENTIFVLDTLTNFSHAAFWWAIGLNPTSKDPRQWYFTAQQAIEHNLAMLTSEAFHCNVIVISHVTPPNKEGKSYASAIGSALGPMIPTYFPTLVLAESVVLGTKKVRKIKTFPTSVLDLKNPVPWEFTEDLPLETGLLTIFNKLKEAKT